MTQVADAYIRLVVDEKDLQRQISSAAGPAGQAAAAGGRTVGDRFSGAFSKAATAGGAAAGTFLVAGIESATAFEDQLRTINTVAGLTDDELAKIGDQIQQVSRDTGKTTDDLTAGFYDLVSAGVPAGEAIGVLSDSAKLSVGALGTTAEAVDAVTSALNAYGLGAEDSSRVTDVLAKAVADGKVTISEIGATIANIAPIAASAGVSLEEVSAGYAMLTAKGVPAAQAATQMRAAISALLTPNETLNDLQEQTGVNFAELAKAEGLSVALDKLRDSTDGNNEVFGKALGSIEAYQFALEATGENADAFQSQILETGDAVGIAAAQYEEKSKSVAEQGKRLVATFVTFAQDVGGPFVGGLGQAVFALNQLGQAFGIPIPAAKLLGGVLGGLGGKLAARLGPRMAGILSRSVASGMEDGVTSGIGRLSRSGKVGGAMGKLGDFMGSKLGKGLSIAFAAIAVVEVIETYNRVKGELDAQTAKIGETVAAQVTTDTMAGLQSKKAVLEKGIADLAGLWWNPFAGDQKAKLEAQLAVVEKTIADRAAGVAPAVGGELAAGAEDVAAGAETMTDPIPEETDKAAAEAAQKAYEIPQGIADAIFGRRDAAKNAMEALKESLLHPMSNAKERARLIGYLTSDALVKGLKSKDPGIRAQAEASQQLWLNQLGELPLDSKGLGGKAGQALADALKSKNPEVRAAAQRVKDTVDARLAATKGPAGAAGRQAGDAYKDQLQRAASGGSVRVTVRASFIGKMGAQGLAVGGPVQKGEPYIVGEKGWEIFVPDVSGQIISHADSVSRRRGADAEPAAGFGSATINVPINVQGALPVRTIRDIATELQRAGDLGVVPDRLLSPLYHRREAAGA